VAQKCCPHCGDTDLRNWAGSSYTCAGCSRILREYQLVAVAPPPLTRPTRTISDRHEKINAKRYAGRRTIASGATPVDKADVKGAGFRMECKSTEKKSFSLKLEELHKLIAQAKDGEIPAFTIEFRPQDRAGKYEQYVVLPDAWFKELLETYTQVMGKT
jgi:hypothetical protein